MLTITMLSLAAAGASGWIAWRAVRREHLRADARVALLAAAIDAPGPVTNDFSWPPRDESESRAASALFNEHAQTSTRRRPLLTAAAGLSVVLTVVVLIAMTGNRNEVAKSPVSRQHQESIELLSMRSVHKGSTLAVTGLVRNRSAQPVNAMTAIVSAFDNEGHPVGMGTTPVSSLSPGEESLFLVTIPDISGVARYRVSFRDASGVIRHMDRRTGISTVVS